MSSDRLFYDEIMQLNEYSTRWVRIEAHNRQYFTINRRRVDDFFRGVQQATEVKWE